MPRVLWTAIIQLRLVPGKEVMGIGKMINKRVLSVYVILRRYKFKSLVCRIRRYLLVSVLLYIFYN
jgi:hypothetical protein